ncbi:SMP-30/gluconolactonase/LRE family protein [Sphingomonas montanisoli]|uniref:SMP-30/gluconolactonase/LRE family protein n=1 Tax=Sphingomonas montanisoli TaxID=2606412 RepID=A0A5D9CCE1_9SPHN|nr:SMP-30/gluconolactonase/LRE family protein [Sphingomonas montanisoli]TZG29414.1 SMP-30/gluconolactonase/LRE family protein [Sphingomonas montanisoli]
MKILAKGLAFPEGPVVMPDGSIVVVELRAGTVRRIWGEGKFEVIATPGGGPNGAQLGPDGALYIANNGGIDWARGLSAPDTGRIERIDPSTGKVERLCDQIDGRPLRAPNDLVFDAAGGLWFTDMGKTIDGAIETSAVCYLRPDGTCVAAWRGGISYNGIGLSPDERFVYVAETQSARLWRFAVEAPGVLGAPTWVATAPGDTRFDSLAVTASGNICVGTLKTGGITTIGPNGGTQFTPIDDLYVTNIAFGGANMRTAFITLAASGRLISMDWPEPGLPPNFGYTTSSTTSSTRPSGS